MREGLRKKERRSFGRRGITNCLPPIPVAKLVSSVILVLGKRSLGEIQLISLEAALIYVYSQSSCKNTGPNITYICLLFFLSHIPTHESHPVPDSLRRAAPTPPSTPSQTVPLQPAYPSPAAEAKSQADSSPSHSGTAHIRPNDAQPRRSR